MLLKLNEKWKKINQSLQITSLEFFLSYLRLLIIYGSKMQIWLTEIVQVRYNDLLSPNYCFETNLEYWFIYQNIAICIYYVKIKHL